MTDDHYSTSRLFRVGGVGQLRAFTRHEVYEVVVLEGDGKPDDPYRTVHPEGEQIVRYDRAGKWFVELVEPSLDAGWRGRIGVRTAARRAHELVEMGGDVFLRRPGGGAFDREYERVTGVRQDGLIGGAE